jgi:cell division septation protein DedD
MSRHYKFTVQVEAHGEDENEERIIQNVRGAAINAMWASAPEGKDLNLRISVGPLERS